jgi:hypothetical protein
MPRATCQLPHLEPEKIQVDASTWSQMQKAVADALTAQATVADRIAQAVAAERSAAQAQRSDDATGIQAGNRLLREQLTAANEDLRERDKRILELLGRVDKLQQSVAELKGERAEVTLVNNREQRSLALAQAQLTSSDQRFKLVMHQLGPLVPLVARVGLAAAAPKIGVPPSTAGASAEASATASVVDATAEAPGTLELEVIQSVTWTQARIDEWKNALCDVIQAITPRTAAEFRFYLLETNALGLLSAPPETLPEMVRALVAEAGSERVQRLQELTAAARPS